MSNPHRLGSAAEPTAGEPTALADGSLALERHTLANGLRVVLHRDPSLPLVAVNICYHVGSKNEEPGRTGFAHLFEHMLFQGSENVGTNDHFRLVQQAGGVANGSTWYDRTTYHEVLPRHHLDLGLWLESDRMGFVLPALTQEKLDNQRDVVMNERRQKIDNQPYGRAFERLQELLYGDGHPYHWPVIGYLEDIAAATLEDIHRFFATYYRPDNAVLSIGGDIDCDHTLGRIEHYFGDIPAGVPPAGGPVTRPVAPAASAGGGREIQGDEVKLPRVYLGYRVPAFGDRRWYAADLLACAWADGKSSILYQDLVYHRRLAQDVGCYVLPTELEATFVVAATAKPGVDVAELEAALGEHLDRLVASPLASPHLERAKNLLLTGHYSQLQTLERRTELLSLFTTYFDRPELVAAEVERYQRRTEGELSALATEFLAPERRTTVLVVPREDAP